MSRVQVTDHNQVHYLVTCYYYNLAIPSPDAGARVISTLLCNVHLRECARKLVDYLFIRCSLI